MPVSETFKRYMLVTEANVIMLRVQRDADALAVHYRQRVLQSHAKPPDDFTLSPTLFETLVLSELGVPKAAPVVPDLPYARTHS